MLSAVFALLFATSPWPKSSPGSPVTTSSRLHSPRPVSQSPVAPSGSSTLLRAQVATAALAQATKMDSQWHTNQRDCAGLVRFAYRSAFRKLRPNALPLWKDRTGIRRPFADAETLLGYNFESLGRSEGARIQLRSGDLVAFRQLTADGPAFHLMLIVQSEDPAHAAPRVVYHPGQKDADVRVGTLAALMHEAPHEWRPIETNAAFLGYFRLKEWMHE